MANKKEEQQKKSMLNISFGGASLKDMALFAKNMAIMLKSGLPLYEAVSIAQESSQGKLKQALDEVSQSIQSGQSLSDSFARHPKVFSGLFVNATMAGESSGTLVENLENISTELEKERELKSKIQGAMVYPIVVLITAFILGMVLALVVLPKITPLFSGLRIELPFSTRVLIAVSEFMQAYGIWFAIAMFGAVFAFVWFIRQKFSHPITHRIMLLTPIIKKVNRASSLARFSRTLAMLLRSGVRIDEALEITAHSTKNYYYRKAILTISDRIKKGSKLSDNLARFPSYFPPLLTRMVGVGEESGEFEDTLFYLAEFYEDEVDQSTKALSTAVEPILLFLIGGVVAFLALSIITPIYEITGNIKR